MTRTGRAVHAATAIAICLPAVAAAAIDASDYRVPYQDRNRFGYITRAGEIAIPADKDAAWAFACGVGRFLAKGKFGFVDVRGRPVLAPQWDRAWDARDGLVTVLGDNVFRVFRLSRWDGGAPLTEQQQEASFSRNTFWVMPASRDRIWCADGFAQKWILYSTTGEPVIEAPEYEAAMPFVGERSVVRKNGLWGLVDRDGRVVVRPRWKKVGPIADGALQVLNDDGTQSFVDTDGKPLFDASFKNTGPFGDGVALTDRGHVDRSGAVVFGPRPFRIGTFNEGLAQAQDPKTRRWGYIDKTGAWKIPARYAIASEFAHGLAQVRWASGYGYITTSGKLVWQSGPAVAWSAPYGILGCVIEKRGDWVCVKSVPPHSAAARARILPGARIVRIDGVQMRGANPSEVAAIIRGVPGTAVRLSVAYGGHPETQEVTVRRQLVLSGCGLVPLLWPAREGGMCGYIDHRGDWAIEPRFEDAEEFWGAYAGIKMDGKHGFIDSKGAIVVEPRYQAAGRLSEGLAWVQLAGRAGYVDAKGDMVIPARYRSASEFREGLASVEESGGFGTGTLGFIDKKGAWAIEPNFSQARSFHEGLAAARSLHGTRFGYLDRRGEWAIEPRFAWCGDFSEGLAPVRVDSESSPVGFIGRAGKLVLPPAYGEASPFREGRAEVRVEKEIMARAGFIDRTGRLVIPQSYVLVGEFSEGLAPVTAGDALTGFRRGYVDPDGAWVVKPQYVEAEEFRNGLARVKVDGTQRYIDHTGAQVWPKE